MRTYKVFSYLNGRFGGAFLYAAQKTCGALCGRGKACGAGYAGLRAKPGTAQNSRARGAETCRSCRAGRGAGGALFLCGVCCAGSAAGTQGRGRGGTGQGHGHAGTQWIFAAGAGTGAGAVQGARARARARARTADFFGRRGRTMDFLRQARARAYSGPFYSRRGGMGTPRVRAAGHCGSLWGGRTHWHLAAFFPAAKK